MNTKHGLFIGIAVLLLSAIFTFTGCSDDSGDDGGGGGGSLNLPDITEETTGRATITETNITLTGDGASSVTIPQQTFAGAGTWSVASGKLSFSLPQTPTGTTPVSTWLLGKGIALFNKTDGAYAVTARPDDADIYGVTFSYSDSNSQYFIQRGKGETDMTTYSIESKIVYVYVSKDVTLTRSEKTIDGTVPVNFAAINLSLKKGWNLVQTDSHATRTSETTLVKIADKNIPWDVYVKSK